MLVVDTLKLPELLTQVQVDLFLGLDSVVCSSVALLLLGPFVDLGLDVVDVFYSVKDRILLAVANFVKSNVFQLFDGSEGLNLVEISAKKRLPFA